MTTTLLWAGTAFIALVLGLLIWTDIRFRSNGRRIDAVARVTGHRESSDSDGDRSYFNKLTFTDHRGATREISGSFGSSRPTPIGTQIPIHYPEDRSDLARERDGGCGRFFFYAVAVTMLLAFGTAALLGFGEGIDR
jgi:hypothetical protein